MKTVKIFSALILSLVLFSVNAVSAANNNDNNQTANPTAQVIYQVSVHFSSDRPLCNDYRLEILDATGKLVAPPQMFVPDFTTYKFTEQTRQEKGIRIARLVEVPKDMHYNCPTQLFTPVDAQVIEFCDGAVYQFNLTPRIITNGHVKD
jgi:hypothetical protein